MGKKSLADSKVEFKARGDKDADLVDIDKAVPLAVERIKAELARLNNGADEAAAEVLKQRG